MTSCVRQQMSLWLTEQKAFQEQVGEKLGGENEIKCKAEAKTTIGLLGLLSMLTF